MLTSFLKGVFYSMTKEWWQTAFGKNYLQTYVDVLTDKRTSDELKFILRTLKIRKGSRILDVGCGFGRHSIPLGKKGFHVTGIDYSPLFIRLARKEARRLGVPNVHFARQDMRAMHMKDAKDAAICMFTSFGYFKKLSENEKVITQVSKLLVENGVFLLDTNNHFRIAKLFRNAPSVTQVRELTNGITLKTVQKYDLRAKKWKMVRTWKQNGKLHTYRTNVQLYAGTEIKKLLKKNGLQVVSVFGNYDSSPYTKTSPRLIVLAKKLTVSRS